MTSLSVIQTFNNLFFQDEKMIFGSAKFGWSCSYILWQLCAAMMSWVQQWVVLVVYYQIQNFLSYLQKIAKSFSNFCYSHSLNFQISGSPESVSKQPTQVIVEFNSSLWHIIVTHNCMNINLFFNSGQKFRHVEAKWWCRRMWYQNHSYQYCWW